MASLAGGMDIEEVAAKTPEKIVKVAVKPTTRMQPFHARALVYNLGLEPEIAKQFSVGASVFYRDYSDKYFVSIDSNTLTLQGVNNIQANDIIAGGIRLLAGF